MTVWAVLVPEALAYATIAGVSPVVGLYAAPVALVLYAFFGSSKQLVVGPMAATAALSAAVVGGLAADDSQYVLLTAALALVVGGVALVAGLLRMGFVANFISEPVLKGFIIGLALTIMVGQLPKLFGLERGEGNFFEQLVTFVRELGQTHPLTLAVGGVSLAIVLGLRRFAPAIPAPLMAVLFGTLAVAIFALDSRGVDIVGAITPGLPSVRVPDISAGQYLSLAGPAVGIMLVGFVEGLGAARTYAARARYPIDANRELIGLGASNVAAGFASGMVVNGSLSKTAVNASAGARSQVSSLVAAGVTVITLLFLTRLFQDLPEATLAAIVIAALYELVDVPSLVRLYRAGATRARTSLGVAARSDFLAALAALVGVLLFDTLPGLLIGIGISMLLLLYRASRPRVVALGRLGGTDEYVDSGGSREAEPIPGISVLRVESGLFFGNAEFVRDAIHRAARQPGVQAVVYDAGATPFMDVTGVRMLEELRSELSDEGKQLVLARDIGQVRDALRGSGDALDLEFYPTVQEAVDHLTLSPSGEATVASDPAPGPDGRQGDATA